MSERAVVLVADEARGASVEYVPGALGPDTCAALMAELDAEADRFTAGMKLTADGWSETPRLATSFADIPFAFVDMEPSAPWPAVMAGLRDRLAEEAGHPFNYAMANCYRDGRDHAGWHADKAEFHVPGSSVAIVSLGAPRCFRVRETGQRSVLAEVDTQPGSVIWMRGTTQDHYEHTITAVDEPVGVRFSLTFRHLPVSHLDDRPAREPDDA